MKQKTRPTFHNLFQRNTIQRNVSNYVHREALGEIHRKPNATSIRYFSIRKLVASNEMEWMKELKWSRCLKLTNTNRNTMESPLSHSHEEILVNFISSSFSFDVDSFPCWDTVALIYAWWHLPYSINTITMWRFEGRGHKLMTFPVYTLVLFCTLDINPLFIVTFS